MGIKTFFKKAFSDMKSDAKAQHEVDRANLAAAKAEAKATFNEARMSPSGRRTLMQKERDEAIAAANERQKAAEERTAFAKENKK